LDVRFEWNPEKADANLSKHGVSFEEARTVFSDPMFLIFGDPDHSLAEKRFLAVGMSDRKRLLIVSYTERHTSTRLISARKVTRRERKMYEEEDI
jgi:uncharacterized DUF497 family protein